MALNKVHVKSVPGLSLVPATIADASSIVELIRDLADYEKLLHLAQATEEQIIENLFGKRPYAEVILVVVEGETVGFSLFFHSYTTVQAKPGVYLEDLFVKPAFRNRGMFLWQVSGQLCPESLN